MVTTVTSLGRSGLSDWMIQRISAWVMTTYLVFIFVYSLPCLIKRVRKYKAKCLMDKGKMINYAIHF